MPKDHDIFGRNEFVWSIALSMTNIKYRYVEHAIETRTTREKRDGRRCLSIIIVRQTIDAFDYNRYDYFCKIYFIVKRIKTVICNIESKY